MNGSKTILLVAILLMALIPWGLLYYAVNSPDGAGLFASSGPDPSEMIDTVRREEALRHEALVRRLENQIELLQEKSDRLEEELSETSGDGPAFADLKEELEEEKQQKERALERAAELRKQYDEAMSKIVQLSTQVGIEREKSASAENASSAPRGTAGEPSAIPYRSTPDNRTRSGTTDTGGWILPPSN